MPHRRLKEIVAGQDLLYVGPSATVREAADRMRERHVGAALVIDEGVLRGIFTERDLLQRVVASGYDPETTFVAQVMSHDPHSLDGDRQGIEAMRIMREEGIQHVAVTGLAGIGYGVISMRDFLGTEVAAFEKEFEFEERVWQEV